MNSYHQSIFFSNKSLSLTSNKMVDLRFRIVLSKEDSLSISLVFGPGMDGVDKEKVKRVVYEMSVGSRFFANEQRKEAALQKKLEGMRRKMGEVTLEQLEAFLKVTSVHVLHINLSSFLTSLLVSLSQSYIEG